MHSEYDIYTAVNATWSSQLLLWAQANNCDYRTVRENFYCCVPRDLSSHFHRCVGNYAEFFASIDRIQQFSNITAAGPNSV